MQFAQYQPVELLIGPAAALLYPPSLDPKS